MVLLARSALTSAVILQIRLLMRYVRPSSPTMTLLKVADLRSSVETAAI